MFSYIRPVGEPISTTVRGHPDDYPTYDAFFYASGTMALQQALTLAKKNTHSSLPEVLLPAYACPDLISACVGAGLKAILLDLDCATSPFPSIETIQQHTNDNTVALVLVNFLGISPDIELFNCARALGVLVIEDRAQSFAAPNEAHFLHGDYVIFSFGKGKPVSLLGGGALLIKAHEKTVHPTADQFSSKKTHSKLPWIIRLYNLIISPLFYYLLMKLPGLSIGETHYKTPEKVVPLDDYRRSLLRANIEKQYRALSKQTQIQLYTLCTQAADVKTLNGTELTPNLLRFPLLVKDHETREKLLTEFNQQGIGASKMYQNPLPNIKGVPLSESQRQNNYPYAQQFADRLLTLPCHSGVNASSLRKIAKIFNVG